MEKMRHDLMLKFISYDVRSHSPFLYYCEVLIVKVDDDDEVV